MATTGQNNYVLNIVELQNTVTSATGLSPTAFLSNQLVQIQQMVDYTNKQVNTNVISNFDATPIQIVAPINLSNVALTATGDSGSIGGTTTAGTTSTTSIGSGTNGTLYIGANSGVPLLLTANSLSTFFIESSGNGTFTGTVTAQNFITSSDERLKRNIRPVHNYETILSHLEGVRFNWRDSGKPDIGLIAQDVSDVLPEAVQTDSDGFLQVAYMKVIPVLVEAVKTLQRRVEVLEARANA